MASDFLPSFAPAPAGAGPAPVRALLLNLAGGFRCAAFLRVPPDGFRGGAGQFAALAAVSVAVSLACAVVLAGPDGELDLQALPSEVFWMPFALFAGYLGAKATGDVRYAGLVPVVAGAVAIAFTVLSTIAWFALDQGWMATPWFGIDPYRVMFAWWVLAAWLAVRRLATPATRHPAAAAWIALGIVLVPAWLFPPDPLWVAPDEAGAPESAAFSEEALYAQPGLLREALARLQPQRPGVQDLYFVAFAPFAGEDVFMKESQAVVRLMDERFDTAGRSVALVSHASLMEREPIATLTSLRETLRAVGRRIDPDEDAVMLHLTSHGGPSHELDAEFAGLDLAPLRPDDIRAALDDAGIRWRIVVVSACYAGGFIEALKDAHTMVVTAADATHTSFGCGSESDFTYFSRAYYDEALRRTHSFERAFVQAREAIRARELGEGLEPSNPQLYVGQAIRPRLAALAARLDAGAHGR